MKKLSFETQYRDPKSFNSCVGDREVIDYAPEYDENGDWHLIETGKHSLYDEIQSHKDSVDINKILRRFEAGEVDVLQKVQGVYGDFSDVPSNFAELLNTVDRGREMFDSLPIEIKEKFGQNFVAFMQSFGSPDWLDKMGMVSSEENAHAESTEKEVKTDES